MNGGSLLFAKFSTALSLLSPWTNCYPILTAKLLYFIWSENSDVVSTWVFIRGNPKDAGQRSLGDQSYLLIKLVPLATIQPHTTFADAQKRFLLKNENETRWTKGVAIYHQLRLSTSNSLGKSSLDRFERNDVFLE